MELAVFKGQQLTSDLIEQIIQFDMLNMGVVLEQAGIAFPEENRRTGLPKATIIVAFDGPVIAGYIDYGRSWNDARNIYIGSLQIAEPYRHSDLILALLDRFREQLATEAFSGFEANVQKTNRTAVNLYRKFGFQLTQSARNNASFLARADKRLLIESPIVTLINRWKVRNARRKESRPPDRS